MTQAHWTIGWIGLGTMGAPMAWNLHRAGHALRLYNRNPERTRSFAQAGIPVAASPREAAQGVQVVGIMVTGPEALEAVLQGEDGVLAGLAPGTLVINFSTVSPEATEAAHQAVLRQGGRFLDVPVSGSRIPAEEGQLILLAGGEPTLVEAASPVLAPLGKRVIYCGPVGQGTRMKLMINLLMGGMLEAFVEALTFGEKVGLDLETMCQVIQEGAMRAPLFQMKGEAIRQGQYAPHFALHLLFKDLNLALAEAGRARISLPVTAAAREAFCGAMAQGLGDWDIAALYLEAAHRAGLPGAQPEETKG